MKMVNIKWSRHVCEMGEWSYKTKDLIIPIDDIFMIIGYEDEEGNKCRVRMKSGEDLYSSIPPEQLSEIIVRL